jgi:alpha-glucosidase
VALQSREDDSLYNWYQQLIQMRRENPALRDGSLTMLNVNDNNVLSWLRKAPDGQSVLFACNFTAEAKTVRFDLPGKFKTLLKTPGSADPESSASVKLPPYGVYIGQIQ